MPTRWKLKLSAACFANSLLVVLAAAQEPPPSALDVTSVLNGTVVDHSGAPAAGVEVAVAEARTGQIVCDAGLTARAPQDRVLFFFHKRNSLRAGTATTDTQGRFALRGLSPGQYNVAALSPQGQVTLRENVEYSPTGGPLDIVFDGAETFSQSVVFSGLVLDPQGQPLSGARVTLADAQEGLMFAAPMGGGAQPYVMPFASGRHPRFPWFSSSRGLTGSASSDGSGSFSIPGLRPGVFNLIVSHPAGVQIVPALEVRQDTSPADLRLDPPTFIQGTLKCADPATRYLLSFMQLSPEGLPARINLDLPVRLAVDGTFRAGPLPAARGWTLRASQPVPAQGYVATILELSIAATPGQTTEISLDFTAGSPLSGEVRGPAGQPLSGVSVLARALQGSPRMHGAVSGADGKYVIAGLADGRYELTGLRHAPRSGLG